MVDQQVISRAFADIGPYGNFCTIYRDNYQTGVVFRDRNNNRISFTSDSPIVLPDINDYSPIGTPSRLVQLNVPGNLPTGYLDLGNGTRMRVVNGYIMSQRDRNGNLITFEYENSPTVNFVLQSHEIPLKRLKRIIDSTNREIMFEYDVQTNSGIADIITFSTINNQEKVVKVFKTNLHEALQDEDSPKSLRELFDASQHWQLQNFSISIKYNPAVFSRIESESGTIQFKYNSYGELTEIINNNGSKTKYIYGAPYGGNTVRTSNYNQYGLKWDSWFYYRRLREIQNYERNNELVSRTEIKDITVSENYNTTVEIYNYDNDNVLIKKTDKKFYSKFPGSVWNAGLEFEEIIYKAQSGNITPYKKTEKIWTHGPIGVTPGVGDYSWWNGQLNTIFFTELRRNSSEKIILLDTPADLISEKTFSYDEFLNVTSTNEYNWGTNGNRGSLIRSSSTEYLKVNPVTNTNYTSHGQGRIVGLPVRMTIRDKNSVPVSVTEYEYDKYTDDGNHSPIKERPNIINNCIYLTSSGQCNTTPSNTFKERGNVTSVINYKDPINRINPIITYNKYDVAGNVVSSKDALGNETKIEYDDAFSDGVNRNTFAFPTKTISPVPDINGIYGSSVALETSTEFDYSTGLKTLAIDENGQETVYQYTDSNGVPDSLNRVKKVIYPDGGWVSYNYNDTPGNIFVHIKYLIQNNPTQIIKEEYQYYDDLLRPIRAYSYEPSDSISWVGTETIYTSTGEIEKITNPVRVSSPGDNIPSSTPSTVTEYDGLGRTTKVTGPDGSVVRSAYSGNKTMVTDQAGKSRMIEKNAAGQITRVAEYNRQIQDPTQYSEPNSGDSITLYQYSALDKLTKVTQGSQIREFGYDALNRLILVDNPESGETSFEYYNDGKLKKKIDSRNIATELTYDKIGRLIKKSYIAQNNPSTPNVEYYYDGKGLSSNIPAPNFAKGRLTATKNSVSETLFTNFDSMGRVIANRQVINPLTEARQEFPMEYTYNLSGNMTSQKYPSGKIVITELDAANRVSGIRSNGFFYVGGNSNSVNRIKYTENGDLTALKFGNGLWQHIYYNERHQPFEIGIGTALNDSSLLKLEYFYGVLINNTLDPLKNNSNIQSQKITAPGIQILTQTYEYDYLNRLASVQEKKQDGTLSFNQVFNYDQYGNRTISTSATSQSLLSDVFEIDPLKNRISTLGYNYDSAGNLTQKPGSNTNENYVYDAENRLSQHTVGQSAPTHYFYDGDGKRIQTIIDNGVVQQTTFFIYNINGQIVEEYSNQPITDQEISYISQDYLGSTRLTTDKNRVVKSRHDYLPFGEEINPLLVNSGRENIEYNQGNTRHKFAGKERDLETGLDYFGARYYSSSLGRFMSPDAPFADQYVQNPQSWNLYSYTRNNPIRAADKDGRITPLDLLDIVAVLWDAFQWIKEPTIENAAWLVTSVAFALAPEIPNPRVVGWVDDAYDVAKIGAEAIAYQTKAWEESRQVARAIDSSGDIGNGSSLILGSVDEVLENSKKFYDSIPNIETSYRIDKPVYEAPREDWVAKSFEERIEFVVDKYGMNLQGQTIRFDTDLGQFTYGATAKLNPYDIRVGYEAISNETALATTIAHELRHSRDYIRQGWTTEAAAYAAQDALTAYILGQR